MRLHFPPGAQVFREHHEGSVFLIIVRDQGKICQACLARATSDFHDLYISRRVGPDDTPDLFLVDPLVDPDETIHCDVISDSLIVVTLDDKNFVLLEASWEEVVPGEIQSLPDWYLEERPA